MRETRLKVLLVEDNQADATLVLRELRQAGFDPDWRRVDTASDFLALLDFGPEVILCDFNLPQFSARHALQLLRERKLDIPFIIVSGSIGEDIAAEAMQQGAADYLLKDRLGRLKPAVTQALEQRQLRAEKQRVESALRESEALFRNAFDHTNVAMVLTDLDNRFLRVNEAFARMFGYSQAEMLKLSMPDITHPEDLAESYARRQALLAGGIAFFQMEKRYFHKDGHILWGLTNVSIARDARGLPHQYVGQVQDITDRKRSEEALRRSEIRLRSFIERARDIIFDLSADGRFLALNPAFETTTGWPVEDWLGKPFPPLIHAQDVPRGMELFQRAMAGEEISVFEIRIHDQHGAYRTVEISAAPSVEDGLVTGVRGIARDITERKQLEEQFRQAQKMEAIGRLAGGVAHDFNNLLTVILGYSEIVMGQLHAGDPMHGLIEQIHQSGERASHLTRQLLAFSRKQVLQPVVLDLNMLLGEMEKMLRRLIGEDIDLRFTAGQDLCLVRADAGQIEQVVMNIVINARDAMPHGGTITIETANVQLDADYAAQHPAVPPGSYLRLAISDTGVGMNSATKARLFEPFFSTKGDKGTGLGLATVFGIIKQSGGHIEVYSELGVGTTFKIYLPRHIGERSPPAPLPGKISSRHGTETILLVEDETDVRNLAALILRREGYTVIEARNGGEALLHCEQTEAPIHLLVTDVVMPIMSGRQLAERLGPLWPQMKVLYVSGYTDDAIVQHGVLEAGVPFLNKPYSKEALARKVRSVLDAGS